MRKFPQRNGKSVLREDWETPQELFARYDRSHCFTLDAAANAENTKCARYFTKEDNALVRDWGRGSVWLNPPYGRGNLSEWMAKAWDASIKGATVVCLVPARTDAGWWHDYASRGEVEFLRGRVRFVGAPYNAPFPSAVITFRPPAYEAVA